MFFCLINFGCKKERSSSVNSPVQTLTMFNETYSYLARDISSGRKVHSKYLANKATNNVVITWGNSKL